MCVYRHHSKPPSLLKRKGEKRAVQEFIITWWRVSKRAREERAGLARTRCGDEKSIGTRRLTRPSSDAHVTKEPQTFPHLATFFPISGKRWAIKKHFPPLPLAQHVNKLMAHTWLGKRWKKDTRSRYRHGFHIFFFCFLVVLSSPTCSQLRLKREREFLYKSFTPSVLIDAKNIKRAGNMSGRFDYIATITARFLHIIPGRRRRPSFQRGPHHKIK
jgi:hypothetical protein